MIIDLNHKPTTTIIQVIKLGLLETERSRDEI